MAKPDQDSHRVPLRCTLTPESMHWINVQAKHLDLSPGRVIDLLIRYVPQPKPQQMMDVVTPAMQAALAAEANRRAIHGPSMHD